MRQFRSHCFPAEAEAELGQVEDVIKDRTAFLERPQPLLYTYCNSGPIIPLPHCRPALRDHGWYQNNTSTHDPDNEENNSCRAGLARRSQSGASAQWLCVRGLGEKYLEEMKGSGTTYESSIGLELFLPVQNSYYSKVLLLFCRFRQV